MSELKKLSNAEILELYSNILIELKNREIICTNNLIGDLSESLAINCYNNNSELPILKTVDTGSKNYDALSSYGEKYSIKSTSTKRTGIFYGCNHSNSQQKEKPIFVYLIIVVFKSKSNFELNRIIELNWGQFVRYRKRSKTHQAYYLYLNQKLLSEAKIIL